LDSGGILHLRVQTELWESRAVWDRLVYPAIIRVFRFSRAPSGRDLTVADSMGETVRYATVPPVMPVAMHLGETTRVSPSERYYVHAIVTLGTLPERDIDNMGDAVFGRESETNTLGVLGRMVFRKMLQISDYLQSVTAD